VRKELLTLVISAFVRYSPTTLVVEAVAYKEIQAGEEVSLSCKSAGCPQKMTF
jgi:hypothetical protein